MQLQVTPFQRCEIFKNQRNNNFETRSKFFPPPCVNESAMTRRCQKNTAGRYHRRQSGQAAADQVPVCRSYISAELPCIDTHSRPNV